jgi:hypothetical protein
MTNDDETIRASDDRAVRVVFEHHPSEEWELRTSDLAAFRRKLGSGVLEAFCACYIHADRLNSLITMFHVSLEKFGRETVFSKRNYMAFYAFVVGALKELSLDLVKLRVALKEAGLLDEEAWKAGLQQWQVWGNREDMSDVRNKMAFHVNPDWIRGGVDSACASGIGGLIYAGDEHHLKDSWFRLAHEVWLEGAKLKHGDLETLLGAPREFLGVHDDLDKAFASTLNKAGLKPIVMKVQGRPVPSVVEAITS